jgi:hypothetical protein
LGFAPPRKAGIVGTVASLPPLSASRCTIGTEIGKAGMGVVYEAVDVRLKVDVYAKAWDAGSSAVSL